MLLFARPYISSGDEPPQELVYGEFDVEFFAQVVDRAIELYDGDAKVFCDLGSGTGRLVLVAAALYDWDLVRGIELLPGIHEQAEEKLQSCRAKMTDSVEPSSSPSSPQESEWKQYKQFSPSDDWLNQLSQAYNGENNELITPLQATDDNSTESLEKDKVIDDTYLEYFLGDTHQIPLAPIKLSCGSFDNPYEFFGDANIVFCFSSAMPYHVIVNMARACGRQCKPGSLIITTEYALPIGGTIESFPEDPCVPDGDFKLELVEELHGSCDATGGESTVFIHRLTKSLGTGQSLTKPDLSSPIK